MTAVNLQQPDDDDADALWAEFYAEIDRRLNRARPDRSSPKDRSWMSAIFGWARNHIPNEENLVRHFAEREVVKREGAANKKANRLLKGYALGHQPLFWEDLGPLPFTVDDKTGLRIRFDAASPPDIESRAKAIRASANRRYAAEVAVADVLDELAQLARRAGHARVALIGDLPVREDGRIAELEWDDEEPDEFE